MAKGRKPQGINLQDLMEYLSQMTGESKMPTSAVGAQANTVKRAVPKAIDKANRGAIGIASPLDANELTRLRDSGPDKGHAASLAAFMAFLKAPAALRGARNAYRGNKGMFKDKQAPTGSRTQPKRTASTSMTTNTDDDMMIDSLFNALLNRR